MGATGLADGEPPEREQAHPQGPIDPAGGELSGQEQARQRRKQ